VSEPARTIGVAIAIPEPHASVLQGYREQFGDPLAAFVPAHVTLLPPVSAGPEVIPEVEAHLEAVARASAAFPIRLRGSGTFRPVSPVVFVSLAEGIADCEQLESRVRGGPLGIDLRFPYHPHVTVAHDVSDDMLDKAMTTLDPFEARFGVDRFHLYEHGVDGVWRTHRTYLLG
jgi:2'-5' RNA ligase